jgi:hypothetical protein
MMGIVFTTGFNLEDLLDRRLTGQRDLRLAIEEWAWERVPPEMDGEYEVELSVDGQHIDAAFVQGG